jgi:uncharacterized DUF497 family protein
MGLEWEEEKRPANLAKHDVDVRDVASVFQNPHLTYSSPTADEKRRVAVGPLRPRTVPIGGAAPATRAASTMCFRPYVTAQRLKDEGADSPPE